MRNPFGRDSAVVRDAHQAAQDCRTAVLTILVNLAVNQVPQPLLSEVISEVEGEGWDLDMATGVNAPNAPAAVLLVFRWTDARAARTT